MPPIKILASIDLQEGETFRFTFVREESEIQAFTFRFQGKVRAYQNVCRHIPVSLDYDDNRFFTPDGKHLICQTHGAMYEPATGKCVRGPCPGLSLFALKLEEREGYVWLLEEPPAESSP